MRSQRLCLPRRGGSSSAICRTCGNTWRATRLQLCFLPHWGGPQGIFPFDDQPGQLPPGSIASTPSAVHDPGISAVECRLRAIRQAGASRTAHLLAPRLRAQLLRARGPKISTAQAEVKHPPTGNTEMTVDGGVTQQPPNSREPRTAKRHRRPSTWTSTRSERLGRGEGRLLRPSQPGASRLASSSAAGGTPAAKVRRRQCSSRPWTPNCSNWPSR